MATTIGGETAAPSRLALCDTPWTRPRSRGGNQSCMARVATGNAPASPMPNRNRTAANEATPLAAAVSAVMTDQYVTMPVNIRRGPKRSPNQPPGTWNSA